MRQSAVILIFISGGYFKSHNCMREVIATLEQGKAYLFVHEADPGKGGGPLIALQLELNDVVIRERLFDGRRATVWHRIKEVQLGPEPKAATPATRRRLQPLNGCLCSSLSCWLPLGVVAVPSVFAHSHCGGYAAPQPDCTVQR